jgi:4-hydroxy-tetrahydrodipicolinate synthase
MLKVLKMQRDGFQVITAVASQLFVCLSMGSRAHTSSLGSCMPELMIEIYDLFSKGDHKGALARQYALNSLLERFPARPKQENFLMAAVEKYILSLRGICSEYTTSYYTELTDDEKKIVESIWHDTGLG